MLRRTLAAAATVTALLGAGSAQAGTSWSIGISLPPVGVVVADTPRYVVREPAPVYYAPPPVVYAPRYVEREVYYAPPPRVIVDRRGPGWHGHRHWDDRWDDRRDGRYERPDRWDGRYDTGPHRGR